jgi:outer membrane protein TolC
MRAVLLLLLLLVRLPAADKPLTLDEVLNSVRGSYPPYLAALIEMDIANGRVRQASGAFDLTFGASVGGVPSGYYDGRTGDAVLEQALPFWGGSVFGGYRLSSGFLPNYNKDRTQRDGDAILGFKLNLLRDGTIDRRRAQLYQARVDQELADPIILRQYLDFLRAASISYWNWLAAGHRWRLAEELLRVAKDRDVAIAEQAQRGAVAPIVRLDNERLVVSREIGVVQAQRRFEAAAIELSLFHRNADDEPILNGRQRLPAVFPEPAAPSSERLEADVAKALIFRPEIRRIDLNLQKADIDRRLAKNNLLPNLDVTLQTNQAVGERTQKDMERLEMEAKLQFSVPLQRNEAKGRLQTIEAMMSRLQTERDFARDRIRADVRDALSAVEAAHRQIGRAQRNVELAVLLEQAEAVKFEQGAADLFALQIREQATFDARQLEVEAHAEFLRALANHRAAVAADAPAALAR